MKQTVYVDVLVAVNLFITYFLLRTVAGFLTLPVRRGRMAAASAAGGLCSLLILLPELPAALSVAVKLLMSAGIVALAFGYGGVRRLIRDAAAFFGASFAFAGLMLAVWYFFAPQGLVIRNSIVYFNVSPLLLIALTVACYFALSAIGRVTGRRMPRELRCRMVVGCGGRSCSCTAKVDTGNTLREPFSNDPVAVVFEPAVRKVVPPPGSRNLRLVPFDSVAGSGVLRAFRPDRLTLFCAGNTIRVPRAYIAVSPVRPGECDALLNPELLQKNARLNLAEPGETIKPRRQRQKGNEE